MNGVEKYFRENKSNRLVHKWEHYFEIYDRYLSQYRGKEIRFLEIGVSQGGSLQMWKAYFGDKAKIYGVDINPNCKSLEEENIEIFIGSQSDPVFLNKLKEELPPFDIILDDGGHTMEQQIVTFRELFGHVKPHGLYLCEDTHTSYLLKYGGGYKRRGSFIEFTKNLIDELHAFHSKQSSLQPTDFTRSAKSIHFFDGVVVIEKEPRLEIYKTEKTGVISFPYETQEQQTRRSSSFYKFKIGLIHAFEKVMQTLRLPGSIWK